MAQPQAESGGKQYARAQRRYLEDQGVFREVVDELFDLAGYRFAVPGVRLVRELVDSALIGDKSNPVWARESAKTWLAGAIVRIDRERCYDIMRTQCLECYEADIKSLSDGRLRNFFRACLTMMNSGLRISD